MTEIFFRTKYNCVINDGETFEEGTSKVQPGRSEGLQHLVCRLTRKPNPTSLDILRVSPDIEDVVSLSPEQIDERFEQVVSLGDKIDAQDALLDAEEALAGVGANPVSGSENEQSVATANSNGTQTVGSQTPATALATEQTKE